MINYSKSRESAEKNCSKRSLGRGLSINKSHTSSINIKLTQDTPIDQIKLPLKSIFREKGDICLASKYQLAPQSHQKKYSVKLQSNEKQNIIRRKDPPPYDVTIFRPFQESNRYLQTERMQKDCRTYNERTPTKQPLRLKTDYQDQKLRTDYTETTPQKMRKDASTKHATENSNKILRVSAQDLRGLMKELLREQEEVHELKRELNFYRKHAHQNNSNSVLRALRV